MAAEVLSIQPGELKFPFELRKQISCSVQLVNTTQSYVAFKVKTTSPKKYCVRPNSGVVLPGATCDITVMMQAQREAPPDMQCKDKFLVQSVVLPDDADHKEVSQELFNKDSGREIFEAKLKVIYMSPPQPPSPVAESAEEGISPTPSFSLENGFDFLMQGKDESNLKVKFAETRSQIAKLTEEKNAAIQKNLLLQLELGKIGGVKRSLSMQTKNPEPGFSFLFVLLAGLLGLLIGYFLHS